MGSENIARCPKCNSVIRNSAGPCRICDGKFDLRLVSLIGFLLVVIVFLLLSHGE